MPQSPFHEMIEALVGATPDLPAETAAQVAVVHTTGRCYVVIDRQTGSPIGTLHRRTNGWHTLAGDHHGWHPAENGSRVAAFHQAVEALLHQR